MYFQNFMILSLQCAFILTNHLAWITSGAAGFLLKKSGSTEFVQEQSGPTGGGTNLADQERFRWRRSPRDTAWPN